MSFFLCRAICKSEKEGEGEGEASEREGEGNRAYLCNISHNKGTRAVSGIDVTGVISTCLGFNAERCEFAFRNQTSIVKNPDC